jgi:hypothetical protein
MIYTTFKQWADGFFLETGEPRKKAYSEDELALVEMGWNYGYDAGVQWQKSKEALDKKAENARELGLDYAPQRTWNGLTDDDEQALYDKYSLDSPTLVIRRVADFLREKNGGNA